MSYLPLCVTSFPHLKIRERLLLDRAWGGGTAGKVREECWCLQRSVGPWVKRCGFAQCHNSGLGMLWLQSSSPGGLSQGVREALQEPVKECIAPPWNWKSRQQLPAASSLCRLLPPSSLLLSMCLLHSFLSAYCLLRILTCEMWRQ